MNFYQTIAFIKKLKIKRMILNEVTPGAVGLIFWYVDVHRELSEKEKESIRQKSVSNAINATITNMMYEPGKAINDLNTVMHRGWQDASKNIEILENGTGITNQYIMIDSNAKDAISKIESTPEFRGWMNPYLIDQIKNLEI